MKFIKTVLLSFITVSMLCGVAFAFDREAVFKEKYNLTIGTDVQAYDDDLTTYAGITPSANIQSLLGAADYAAAKTLLSIDPTPVAYFFDVSKDETTDISVADGIITFRAPAAFTLTEIRASVTLAPTDANLIIDVTEGGTTVLSTLITIDAAELTSTTAAVPAVISDAAIADDALISINVDQVGSTLPGDGLKIWLIGTLPL